MSALLKPGQTAFAFVFDLARTVEDMKQETEPPERKLPDRASGAQPGRRRAARLAG